MDPQNIELELKDEKTTADDDCKEEEDEDEEEELICYDNIEIVSTPPEVDNKSSCGIDRPYFGFTWGSDTDQAKELQRIGKAVSSGELIEGDENGIKEDEESKVNTAAEDTDTHSEIHGSNVQKDHSTDTPLVPKPDETSKTTETTEIWPPKLTIMDLISAIISCVFFITDIASDWRLVVIYFLQKEYTLFGLTIAFIMVPALILGTISIIWSAVEHAHMKAKQSSGSGSSDQAEWDSKSHLVIRVIFSLLQLGRCFSCYIMFVVDFNCNASDIILQK
ncbi:hypothetical protein KUTeg_019571 [Tegillarca granosa]|uniref:XK-related protein n=1 Tax=Tegillarca granosa TaxID=220873 RepID=A0ABQ9EI37_TEGGR|nr:hypothetical protein KUTeg_019571 [Tegillarca granosa]